MARAKRTDSSHKSIRDGLRELGYCVFDVHALPGMLDLDIPVNGRRITLEVKNGPGDELTDAEREMLRRFPLSCFRVEGLQQAIDLLRELDERMED